MSIEYTLCCNIHYTIYMYVADITTRNWANPVMLDLSYMNDDIIYLNNVTDIRFSHAIMSIVFWRSAIHDISFDDIYSREASLTLHWTQPQNKIFGTPWWYLLFMFWRGSFWCHVRYLFPWNIIYCAQKAGAGPEVEVSSMRRDIMFASVSSLSRDISPFKAMKAEANRPCSCYLWRIWLALIC